MTTLNSLQFKNRLETLWHKNKSVALFIVLMFVFRSAIADWNVVPTGSMKPTILEGDRILINKMAYDIRIPFTHVSMHKRSNPIRGDVIVFDSEVSDKRLVKRVAGIPGDQVRLTKNVLYINGERLQYKTVSSTNHSIDKIENLLGVEHRVRVNKQASTMSSFSQIKIPHNYYLVLGDNRDNSADSRAIGLVPRSEIIGRARHVVLSLNYNNYYIPRSDRFFHSL